MTNRMASNTMPAHWKMKPMRRNSISPMEAIITPITMKETLKRTFMSVGATPRPQVTRRTATGIVA